jgi:hypothetical protein
MPWLTWISAHLVQLRKLTHSTRVLFMNSAPVDWLQVLFLHSMWHDDASSLFYMCECCVHGE